MTWLPQTRFSLSQLPSLVATLYVNTRSAKPSRPLSASFFLFAVGSERGSRIVSGEAARALDDREGWAGGSAGLKSPRPDDFIGRNDRVIGPQQGFLQSGPQPLASSGDVLEVTACWLRM